MATPPGGPPSGAVHRVRGHHAAPWELSRPDSSVLGAPMRLLEDGNPPRIEPAPDGLALGSACRGAGRDQPPNVPRSKAEPLAPPVASDGTHECRKAPPVQEVAPGGAPRGTSAVQQGPERGGSAHALLDALGPQGLVQMPARHHPGRGAGQGEGAAHRRAAQSGRQGRPPLLHTIRPRGRLRPLRGPPRGPCWRPCLLPAAGLSEGQRGKGAAPQGSPEPPPRP